MKKIIAVILMLMMSITFLAACGTGNEGNKTEGENPDVNLEENTTPSDENTDTNANATADTSWDTIKEKGEFIIGLDDTFTPMGFRDENNELIGFDIDLANAVCEILGVKPVFQPIDWDAKELELSTKKIDCIWNGMSRTPEREESMTLTKNYLNNRIIIMSVAGKTIAAKEDLKNYKIGIQAKSAALEVLQADPIYAELADNVSEYPTYDEVIMDMDAGRIDVMIVDEVLGMYKNSKRDVSFEVSSVNFGDDFYVIGLRKGEEALRTEIEKAIDTLVENGKAVEISNKWFGKDILIK
jgi:polar amino acid transport system substrate-binding protein